MCTLGLKLCHLRIPGFALHDHLDGLEALAADEGVCFPMADLEAFENGFGTLFDRSPLRDVRFFVFSGVSPVFTLAVGPHQRWDKGGRILVHPLIDGFMADGLFGMLDAEPAGNEFRRPPKAKTFFDIAPDKVALEPRPSMGLVLALLRPLLRLVRQVIAGIDGRGVSLELP
jgi:hypothetical protein